MTASGLPAVVVTDIDFAGLVHRMRAAGRVAIDTEGASFHRYHDRIYLIQLSTADETAIIDPLEVTDLSAIGEVLSDRAIEVVFHDADYDLRVLDRDYGFRAANVFDTRVAAQLLGEPAVGLGGLLEKFFGVKLDKRLQRADWSRRPLTDEMLRYAASDTSYLLDLRDELERRLRQAGRLHWAQEEFLRLEETVWSASIADGHGFLRLKGAKALNSRSLAVLQSVYAWRDGMAAHQDRAPFRIMSNDTLLALASTKPTTLAGLMRVPGLAQSARKHADALLNAVREGLATPAHTLPRVDRGQKPKTNRAIEGRLERLKRLRTARTAELHLEVGILCPNATLQAIARKSPRTGEELLEISELRRWQIEAMGGERQVLECVAAQAGDEA
jgi:ribonuclease D